LKDGVNSSVTGGLESGLVELLKSCETTTKISNRARENVSKRKKRLTLRVEGVFEVLEDEGKLEDGGIIGCKGKVGPKSAIGYSEGETTTRKKETHHQW